jgi:hypothetical protein
MTPELRIRVAAEIVRPVGRVWMPEAMLVAGSPSIATRPAIRGGPIAVDVVTLPQAVKASPP